jgi:hypothetical protein
VAAEDVGVADRRPGPADGQVGDARQRLVVHASRPEIVVEMVAMRELTTRELTTREPQAGAPAASRPAPDSPTNEVPAFDAPFVAVADKRTSALTPAAELKEAQTSTGAPTQPAASPRPRATVQRPAETQNVPAPTQTPAPAKSATRVGVESKAESTQASVPAGTSTLAPTPLASTQEPPASESLPSLQPAEKGEAASVSPAKAVSEPNPAFRASASAMPEKLEQLPAAVAPPTKCQGAASKTQLSTAAPAPTVPQAPQAPLPPPPSHVPVATAPGSPSKRDALDSIDKTPPSVSSQRRGKIVLDTAKRHAGQLRQPALPPSAANNAKRKKTGKTTLNASPPKGNRLLSHYFVRVAPPT